MSGGTSGLSAAELEEQRGEELPAREVMSLIDPSGGSAPVPIDEIDAPPGRFHILPVEEKTL